MEGLQNNMVEDWQKPKYRKSYMGGEGENAGQEPLQCQTRTHDPKKIWRKPPKNCNFCNRRDKEITHHRQAANSLEIGQNRSRDKDGNSIKRLSPSHKGHQ